MKARDIISGWPKGRSVSSPAVPSGDDFAWFEFVCRLAGRDLDHDRRGVDLKREIVYHMAQQVMLNRYFENYRLPRDPLATFRIAGS